MRVNRGVDMRGRCMPRVGGVGTSSMYAVWRGMTAGSICAGRRMLSAWGSRRGTSPAMWMHEQIKIGCVIYSWL